MTAHARAGHSWAPLVAPVIAFVVPLAAFIAVQRGRVVSYDGLDMRAVAVAILHGRLSWVHPPTPNMKGQAYSSYGIGVSLVVVPLYALQQALGMHQDWLVTLTSPLLLATTALVLYATARSLGWSRRIGLLVAVSFALLTMALQMSQELFSEPGVALGVSLLVLGLVRWRSDQRSGPWLVGLGLAVSLLFRNDSVLLVWPAALLALAFVPLRRLVRGRPGLVGVALPALAALGWSMYYSKLTSGSLIPRTYGGTKAGTWITPFWTGLDGLLLSHGKGFFTYNPFLLLAIPGAVLLWRRDRALTVLLVALFLGRALFYARWWDWSGDSSWGPRFMMPGTVPLALLAGYAVSRLGQLRAALRVPASVLVGLLAAAGLAVNAAGVWIGFARSRPHLPKPPAGLTPLQAFRYNTARLHDYFYSFAHSNVGWAFTHWTAPHVGVLPHWQTGPDAVAIVVIVVMIGAAGSYALAARAGTSVVNPGAQGHGPTATGTGPGPVPGEGSRHASRRR